jgi:hypothetical protein
MQVSQLIAAFPVWMTESGEGGILSIGEGVHRMVRGPFSRKVVLTVKRLG